MNSFFRKSLNIFIAVSLYWVVSISLVFINKYLLSSADLKFDAPIFVTWFQSAVTVLICFLLGLLAPRCPRFIDFPSIHIDVMIMWKILPLSIMFLGMITFNNLCLKYVGVAFYFVSRSLSTVFNVAFSYMVLGMSTSALALACCGLIIFGFIVGVDQEKVGGNLSYLGVVYGVIASALVAFNAIYTKKSLSYVNNNVWTLTLYNNLNASFLFIPLMLYSGDFGKVINFEGLRSTQFWVAMVVSGFFGFAIGYVTGLQIQVTSPLTHNISGTAKACAQTIIACLYYAEVKSLLWWIGNFIVLFGSFAYTLVKRREMQAAHIEEMTASLQEIKSSK